MSHRIRRIDAKKGTTLFRAGEDCPGFVRLERGRIKVTLTGPSGREIVLYRVTPGSVCLQTFSCLVDGTSYSAEGTAEEDISGELVPAAAFWTRIAEDAAFRREVLTSVAVRFSDYQQLIEDVALTGFDTRLARVLSRLRDADGFVAATHAALAAETASGRAFVSRRLTEFAKSGLVRQEKGGLRVLNPGALERIAAEDR